MLVNFSLLLLPNCLNWSGKFEIVEREVPNPSHTGYVCDITLLPKASTKVSLLLIINSRQNRDTNNKVDKDKSAPQELL